MPKAEIVEKVLEQIRKRPANHDYFFSKLSSPDWIEPLDKARLFSAPPPALREGNMISFPFWPESQYLERVASDAPEKVAEIMMKIPVTDNVRVHEDLARAAIKLPASLAAKWAQKESIWIEKQERLYFMFPESLGELIAYLASSGELETSLRLAKVVLTGRLIGDQPKRVSARFDAWNYEQLLKKHFPGVLRQSGEKGLALLCDLLNNMLVEDSDETDNDYSYIWRPAIEPHDQNRLHDELRSVLVDAIRDGSMQVIHDGLDLTTVYQALLKHKRPVFKRIALSLLVENHKHSLARELVCNRENFFDIRLQHEYSRLLGKLFSELDDVAKSMVLDWIEEGPTFVDENDKIDSELSRKRKAYWQAGKLINLRGQLPETWEQRYSEIVSDVGEPEHPDFISYSTSWIGPTSPKDASELEAMSSHDIASFLKSWEPSRDWNAPSPEGLGRVLQTVIVKSADRFVMAMDSFRDVDPTYARALLQGLNEAVKAGYAIEWATVIEYLAWIVEQPRNQIRDSSGKMDYDPHWGWACKAVVNLLSMGFEKNTIGLSLRRPAWQIINEIAEDPDPTPQDDEKSTMDPATRSINTTRGEALHAVIKYALWVRREIVGKEMESEYSSFNMSSIPEVRECLERHLDPSIDPSPAIRAVYGQWFPWLLLLDISWGEAKAKAIFSLDYPRLRDAAWQTYLTFCPAYNDSFRVLEEQYSIAVDHLHSVNEEESDWPSGRLGEHLMVMVGRGVLAWSDENSLVKRFFCNATVADASHAVAFIGRSLQNESDHIPGEVVERFRTLWEHLANNVIAEAIDRTQLLKPFGWWFASERFDAEWALKQLSRVVETTGEIEPDFMVMERLAGIATKYPALSLDLLRSLARQDEKGCGMLSWKDSARSVLQAALEAETTKAAAKSLIHELGARGHLQFRELLQG